MVSKCKEEMGVLSVKDQYAMQDVWLQDRLQNVMPSLLKECGLRLWVVLCSEYNEDPVFASLTPALMFHASRTSCLMFSLDEDGKYEALSFCRPDPALLKYYKQGFDTHQEDQMDAIRRAIREHSDGKVAVNVSSVCAMADGLSKHLYEELKKDPEIQLCENNPIAIRWLETRTDSELQQYKDIYRIAMTIQNEAYTRKVITPGVTTTTDVEWYILERINELGMGAWFSPDVDLQREGCEDTRLCGAVIQEGDLIHTDMGITYLGLNTDSQRLGYILKEGETKVPEGLLQGMKRANRFQDVVRENMIAGRTGNEIFLESMKQAEQEQLRPMLYTHPIGYYGHGAGPIVGLYNSQKPQPGRGEIPLQDHTCYALELNNTSYVPEWEQDVVFYIEETIAYADEKAFFMDPEGRTQITEI